MQYAEGKIGRVFVIKIEHEEDIFEKLIPFIEEMTIKTGMVLFLGAIKDGNIVTGPKKTVLPPDPNWSTIKDGNEILGTGTIFWEDNRPILHLHAALGRGKTTTVGCLRKLAQVYLVVEVVILEFIGIFGQRVFDERLGLSTLELE